MEQRLGVNDLAQGMYVSQLDRPWIDTPFLLQGLQIKSSQDIEEIKKYCQYVHIDIERSNVTTLPIGSKPAVASKPVSEPADQPAKFSSPNGSKKELSPKAAHKLLRFDSPYTLYRNSHPVEQELKPARKARRAVHDLLGNVLDKVRAGRVLSGEGIREAVDLMLDSLIRNPDAFQWLNRLRQKDSYTFTHAINCGTLAIAFGRHLGISKDELRDLAIGNLLCDIGKVRLPAALLNKTRRLTETEFDLVKGHVMHGVEILEKTEGINARVIRIVLQHHERLDGSGYPSGLEGEGICVYGRMAGLVDCYDAMTSHTPYRPAKSSQEVLRTIYEWRNLYFQDALVEQFIQCLGIYPTGSLVELNTGEVGIVIAQNKVKRLRPKVMLILDAQKAGYETPQTVDLLTQAAAYDSKPLRIQKALEPGAYGIDPGEFYL